MNVWLNSAIASMSESVELSPIQLIPVHPRDRFASFKARRASPMLLPCVQKNSQA
ncbi:hypothetical protein [Halothece sp. PCC 7418]|uniref:hypothetical protein n=1 Tax=Halothece sp. (strain PCC 7418) TaxID=65093 RepID=UPI001494E728|nr:hypothetical protein [Halothece sp. PCC 7418]